MLADYFGTQSSVVFSFYDYVLLPTLVMCGLWLYRSRPVKLRGEFFAIAVLFFSIFACAGAINYLLSIDKFSGEYVPIVFAGSMGTGACYLVIKVLGETPLAFIKIFSRYAKILVFILFLEYVISVVEFIPIILVKHSMDYRGGFRSIGLGYSVYVAFFSLLGASIAVKDYLIKGHMVDLLIAFMAVVLVLSSFERSAIFAMCIFLTLAATFVIFYGNCRRYGILLLVMSLSFAFMECASNFNKQLKGVTEEFVLITEDGVESSGMLPSILKVKGGSFSSTRSLEERLALQLRAIDVYIHAPVVGYGINSLFMTSVSLIPPKMYEFVRGELAIFYDRIIRGEKQSNAHNIPIQLVAETGLGALAFLYFAVIFPFSRLLVMKKNRIITKDSIYSSLILLALLFFYTFQASPTYYYIFVITAAMIVNPEFGNFKNEVKYR